MAAKQDTRTANLPGIPRRPGRPATGNAKSNAERQAAYRQRHGAARQSVASSAADIFHKHSMPDLLGALTNADNPEWAQLVWVEIGRRMGWLK